jgi:hypothetical protein
MHLVVERRRDELRLVVPAPRQRGVFVGLLRGGSGAHRDKRRKSDRSQVKARLRRGEL